MELVYILSFAILLGTIILCALAAYLLYKIRELKSQELRAQAERQKAERQRTTVSPLPEQSAGDRGGSGQPAAAALYVAPDQASPPPKPLTEGNVPQNGDVPSLEVTPTPPSEPTPTTFFWEYTETGFVPVRPRKTELSRKEETADKEDEGPTWL